MNSGFILIYFVHIVYENSNWNLGLLVSLRYDLGDIFRLTLHFGRFEKYNALSMLNGSIII